MAGIEELLAGMASRGPKTPSSSTNKKASMLSNLVKNQSQETKELEQPEPEHEPVSKTKSKKTTTKQVEPEPEPEQGEEEEEVHDDGSNCEEEEVDMEDEKEQKHSTPPPVVVVVAKKKNKTSYAVTPPAVTQRESKRRERERKELINTDLTYEGFLDKQLPKSRTVRILRRGGAAGCSWKVAAENELGVADILRIGILARTTSIMLADCELATHKQYNQNGEPIVSANEKDPYHPILSTSKNYKITALDTLQACKLRNGAVYSGEVLIAANNSGSVTTKAKTKKRSLSAVSGPVNGDHHHHHQNAEGTPEKKKKQRKAAASVVVVAPSDVSPSV